MTDQQTDIRVHREITLLKIRLREADTLQKNKSLNSGAASVHINILQQWSDTSMEVFQEIITDWRTNSRTWGFIGKLQIQYCWEELILQKKKWLSSHPFVIFVGFHLRGSDVKCVLVLQDMFRVSAIKPDLWFLAVTIKDSKVKIWCLANKEQAQRRHGDA